MSCKIKRKISDKEKVQKAVNLYESVLSEQKPKLTEEFINKCQYVKLSGTLTENAIDSYRTRDMVYLSYNSPRVILCEESVYNLPTLNSVETINNVLNTCKLDPLQVTMMIHYDDQTVADYICYYLPEDWSNDKINNIFKDIEKIMSSCGYFLAIEPEKTYNKENKKFEYIIQYEPNHPDYRKIFLPDILHHDTTVANAEKIKVEGFIPKTNDIYKYSPRIYFAEYCDDSIAIHLVRRHGRAMLNPSTNKLEYADITINTPRTVKFYMDYHIKSIHSFFTFEHIDKKYIKDIQINYFYNMINKLYNIQ